MYKNIAATLQTIERVQRRERRAEREAVAHPSEAHPRPADGGFSRPPAMKLGPLQKIIAFGPLG